MEESGRHSLSLSLERCGRRKEKLDRVGVEEEGHGLGLGLGLGLERCGGKRKRKEKLEEEEGHSLSLPIPTPCLLTQQQQQQQQVLLYNHNNKCLSFLSSICIPELEQGMQIVASNHGWLLLQQHQLLLLLDPVSKNQIKLPPLDPDPESDYNYSVYTFTNPLLDPNLDEWTCTVILSRIHVVMWCHSKHHNWSLSNRIGLTDADGYYIHLFMRVAQAHHHDLTFVLAATLIPSLGYVGVICVDDVVDDYLRLKPIKELPLLVHPGWTSILLSFDQTLFIVSIAFNRDSNPNSILALHVRLWDMEARNWIKLTTLKDHNLFVSQNNGCASSPLFQGQRKGEGRVYFCVNQDCYFYLLQDNTLTPLLLPETEFQFGNANPFWFFHPHLHTTPLPESDDDESSSPRSKKRVTFADEAEDDPCPFMCLPISLMEFFITYLECFDYLSFRATCKTFRSVAPPQVLQSCSSASFPFLMAHRYHGDSTVLDCFSITDPCRNESYSISIPESCVGQKLFAFKDGWLLVSDHRNRKIKFYNPFTRNDIGVPCSGGLSYFNSGGFSTSPTLPAKCFIVAIICWQEGDDEIRIEFWEKEAEESDCVIRFREQLKFEPSGSPCVYHDGAFYFLDVTGYLGVVRLTGGEPKFTWDVYDKPEALNDPPYYTAHLVVCGNELLSVFIGKLGKWVQVFRLNHANMDWIKVDNLRDEYSLFVSTLSSFAVSTCDQPGTGDRIYLPRLRGKTGVVYYSLRSGKYYSLRSIDSMENFCGTKELLGSFWVDPKCSF